MAGREQGRNALRSSRRAQARSRSARLRRRTSLRIRCDLFALEHVERFVEIVDGRDDLVAGVAEHIFIVERGQRLILDDEDPLDDLLTLPEQHLGPRPMTSPPQRTKRKASAARSATGRATVPAAPQNARGRAAAHRQAARSRRSRLAPRDRADDRRRAHRAQWREAHHARDPARRPERRDGRREGRFGLPRRRACSASTSRRRRSPPRTIRRAGRRSTTGCPPGCRG